MTNDEIRLAMEKVELRVIRERRRHEKAMKELNTELAVIRNACPHRKTKYWPDPSGNNDSEHECLVCGKSAHRL